jgi:hypothetical protein
MAQPVPINVAQHANLKVRNALDLGASSGQQVLPINVPEFSRAGNDCPILFIKNAETGQFQAVMLLGLSREENLIYRDGEWEGTYVPEVLRMGPFKLLVIGQDAELATVGVDMESPLVSETEGEPLFDEQGNATEFMQESRDAIENYHQQGQATRAFLSELVKRDLLIQQSLVMEIEGEKVQIDGIYLVDENKVRELPDDVALDYYRRGFLPAIYAHLMSLGQTSRLARLKVQAQREGGPRILGT